MDTQTIQRIGIRAAYRAGRILNDFFSGSFQVHKKGAIDLVTDADLASEKAIVATINESFPDHSFLAEESGASGTNDRDLWIIDPLDGTTNFAHRLPIFAVSIAYAHDGQVEVGIVFHPTSGELFTAIRGQGARLNDQPIRVSSTERMRDSLLVTGFPYTIISSGDTAIPLVRFSRCLSAAQGVRRLGSAALDLCFVACGRFDGYWEEHLKPWDTAAGMLIAAEAGARVTDFDERPYHIHHPQLLAANPHIHSDMVALLTIEDAQ
ncbi:MAG: inositol monophosphatase [Desulfatitalea sp.]|nr:inositol monophosphatase [Desulfatitalea sp.]